MLTPKLKSMCSICCATTVGAEWYHGGGKKMNPAEAKNLAGCCGIFCGLCAKYQSKAPSRCIGCRLGEQHSWCSIYMCCVAKKGLETCIECTEYPCERYVRRQWGADQVSRVAQEDLERIRRVGLEVWLEEQRERRLLVEELLADYNEGRSMSFYCLACILMPIPLVKEALAEIRAMPLDDSDVKGKAKALRSIIQELASKSDIELKLRKKPAATP